MFIFSEREGFEQYKTVQIDGHRLVQWWLRLECTAASNTGDGTLQREVRKEPLTISVAGESE